MEACLVCGANAVINRQNNTSRTIYNCMNCGVFVVSDIVLEEVKKNAGEIASFLITRKLSGSNDTVLITYEKANLDKDYLQLTVAQIAGQFPEAFSGQMDMAMLNLARRSAYAGDEVKIEGLKDAPLFYARRNNLEALSYMIRALQKAGWVKMNSGSSLFPCGLVITPEGWEKISALKEGRQAPDTLLACASRGDDAIGEMFRKAAHKAARDCGYLAENNAAAGAEPTINLALIAQVKTSKIVICDLSAPSGDVYFAAGLAGSEGRLRILTCHESARKTLLIEQGHIPVLFWNDQESLYLDILNAIRANL